MNNKMTCLLAACFLAACADQNPGSADFSSISTPVPVSGSVFSTDCGVLTSNSIKLQLAFSDGHYYSTAKVYSGLSCSAPLFEYKSDTTYSIFDTNDFGFSVSGKINATLISVAATPQSAQQVSDWNTASFCGISNWALNVSRNISGALCGGDIMASAGEKDYDIIEYYNSNSPWGGQAPGDVLLGYRDSSHRGITDAERPTSLNAGVTYHKL